MKRNAMLLTLAVAILCSSAAFAGGEQSKPSQTSHHKHTKNALSQEGWMTARSKHNGSGIVTRYKVQGVPQIGQSIVVDMAFAPVGSEAVQAKAEIRPSEKLGMAVPTNMSKTDQGAQIQLSKSRNTQTSLTVTPRSEGLHQLIVTTTRDGRSSVVSIPVLVGALPASLPTLGEKQTTASGEKIIVMPAK